MVHMKDRWKLVLGQTKGRKIDKYITDYVVYDLETTGTSYHNDRIIEISAIKVKCGEVIDEFSTLVNPGCSIPYYASEVNGITDDMVADAPVFAKVLPEFLDFTGDNVLVGHNIHTFDNRFIYRYAKEYYGKVLANDYVDTLFLARAILPGMKHHRLVDIAAYYGISIMGAHRALNDCHINQQVYECLGKEMENISFNKVNARKCPKCNQSLQKRNGKYGQFWGCTGYPDCRYTENI